MRYYEDFTSKFGFGDGNEVPPDAEAYRQLYVEGLNALLQKHKSEIRVVSFDREGMHNALMIVETGVDLDINKPTPKLDEGYYTAMDELESLDVGRFIGVEVKVYLKDFRKELSRKV